MSNFNQDILSLSFHQALSKPQDLDQETFLKLLATYPYSQPLHFAYQRKQFLDANDADHSKALLYAPSVAWLKEYVEAHDRLEIIEQGAEQDLNSENTSRDSEIEKPVAEQVFNVSSYDENHAQQQENASLEKMIQQGIGSANYFTLEDEESQDEDTIAPATDEKEDVSLYNDDLMPYSFRWWLHKTRLEYADTYQPFANHAFPRPSASQFDASKLEVAILDQQIKEHIFHLQAPEDKLSEEVKQKTVPFAPAKKLDEVIERFIREEPQIHPPAADALNTENKARKSSEEQYTLVTETLANIYVEQGLYPKAVEVFNKLIVRFPEKKSYFALRIQEIEDKF